jgi:hypothetical protein
VGPQTFSHWEYVGLTCGCLLLSCPGSASKLNTSAPAPTLVCSLTQAERLLKQLQHHSLSLTLHEALEQRTVALRCLSSLQPQPTIRANAPRVLV